MISNYKELSNEIDMLKGNINRISVTEDMRELNTMFINAKIRLEEIYNYNCSRIIKLKDN